MAGVASQAGDTYSSWAHGLTSGLQVSVNVRCGTLIICATVTVHQFFCILRFCHLFPLPCGAGSTVPSEGFDSSVIMPFSWCVVAVTLPI